MELKMCFSPRIAIIGFHCSATMIYEHYVLNIFSLYWNIYLLEGRKVILHLPKEVTSQRLLVVEIEVVQVLLPWGQ